MPKVVIPIDFDYASTLCYVAWRIVSELESELEFEALSKGVPIFDRSAKMDEMLPLAPKILNSISAGVMIDPRPGDCP